MPSRVLILIVGRRRISCICSVEIVVFFRLVVVAPFGIVETYHI